jgi:hypothetical protein
VSNRSKAITPTQIRGDSPTPTPRSPIKRSDRVLMTGHFLLERIFGVGFNQLAGSSLSA